MERRGRLAVAAVVPGTGAAAVRGGGLFVTASTVKVDLVAALLLRHGGEGRLTDGQRELAELSIVRSDNAAASELYLLVGGADGLDAAYRALGLVETVAGRDGYWGLTRTSAGDRVRLLRQVFGAAAGPGVAGPGAAAGALPGREWLAALMGRVVAEQAWGVSAAGGHGDGVRLKNGWLPRSATGRWVVNSTGAVGAGTLVAVLSDGWRELAEGVAAVEAAARWAVTSVTPAALEAEASASATAVAASAVAATAGRGPGGRGTGD
ncbi:beta-lactamase family protein [Kitasatospora sp. SolWspMP-SS2h]|uniref:serine hydrolase n=1 Tax=Kitasatospora sp. SolWspMP-SS2h TaxID=1305729 RepID=UPI000DC04D84|nr:serine hydrolase [Kitasatospora sp. SolWspMP-SS2h]RAJ46361.1 beta-lactamase family protein [Kitasatospora sp. SolWspMP-SS2h]